MILVELGARGRATQASGNRSAEGGNIDGGGGYKPIKANLQPSHGTKDSLLGKKISNNTKHRFDFFSFQKWSGNLFNRGTWSAINMGTACLRIYVIISQQLCRETVGNALPPKKR